MNRYRIRDDETGLTYYHPNFAAAKKHAVRFVHANEDTAIDVDRLSPEGAIETVAQFDGAEYHRHW